VSSYFTEVEAYRSTTDITAMSRADCIANGSLIYSGTLETYADTGLTAGTRYYYKVFAKYTVEGMAYYSTGTTNSETTLVAPPILSSAATNTAGTIITLTFDKDMANPSGKHAQFSATVAGAARGITAAALNVDTMKIDLTLASAVTSGQVVTVSYTAGDVTSSDTSPLASFSGQSVINNVPAPVLYQQWTTYPNTPDLTSAYPYQLIGNNGGTIMLFVSTGKYHRSVSTIVNSSAFYYYTFSGGAWTGRHFVPGGNGTTKDNTILQCNHAIYTDSTYTTIFFNQTTP
jgi:uncharacterized repeat protein (TIGR02059 family)